MAKMTNKALGQVLDPPLTGQQVGRLRCRGMPGDVVGAQRWRVLHLDPRFTKDRPPPPRERAPSAIEWLAALLLDAGEEIVAQLAGECGLSIDAANIAVSCIACTLGDVLESRGNDAEAVYSVAGPLSYGPPAAAISAARARLEARVAQLRADADE